MRFAYSFCFVGLLVACGSDGNGVAADASLNGPDGATADAPIAAIDAATDAASGAFALTSTAITSGVLMPDQYTCAGVNISPPLAWTPGPSGTKSYAVVFTDLDNGPGGFLHSVIWDIPANVSSLPENVEKKAQPSVPAGAKQARAYDGQTFGYLGPCPGEVHTYEFELYAVDVATLPGVTTQSPGDAVVTALMSHKLASAKLSVMSD